MATALSGQINILLQEFGNLFKATAKVYASRYYNDKVGRDTLSNSDLLNDMKVEVKDERLVISIYSYFQYVESGRKVGAKPIPFDVLLEWVRKNNIKPRASSNGKLNTNNYAYINQMVWAMRASIVKTGISPRPFLTGAFEEASKEFDTKLNGLVDDITKDILIRFTKKQN